MILQENVKGIATLLLLVKDVIILYQLLVALTIGRYPNLRHDILVLFSARVLIIAMASTGEVSDTSLHISEQILRSPE